MRNLTAESGSGSGRAVQLVYVDENGKLKTDPEAIGALQKLKESSITCSGSDYAQETEEDTVSQESGKAIIAMTPRKCTSTGSGAGASSSTGMDHSKYTMKKLRDEILKHGFGAELVGLKNPRKSVLVELYERCVLRK
ncbi:hypothetical protein EUTSA_v10009747mg [Eutrema salsugineum]|uniref:Uncharacterized protein n=1 Tax=Eutrema salsugineum TaxID=72664 RepID=V4L2R3_EUTSA|nr:hypothetical protein EUTSA_v10009747mg [Eutrema salsugineum]